MSRRLQLTKKGLLMWRLGPLKYREQEKWDRAPEKKGMWAFPYPYYESFFTYHQYLYLAPKRLQDDPRLKVPHGTTFTYVDEEHKDIPVFNSEVERQDSWMYIGPLGEVEPHSGSLYEERDKWVKEVGMKIMPLRKFYWSGSVYCHYHRSGEVTALDEWTIMDVSDLARLITKTRGDRCYGAWGSDKAPRITAMTDSVSYAHDHFEVFLTPKLGKVYSSFRQR